MSKIICTAHFDGYDYSFIAHYDGAQVHDVVPMENKGPLDRDVCANARLFGKLLRSGTPFGLLAASSGSALQIAMLAAIERHIETIRASLRSAQDAVRRYQRAAVQR